jgi:rhodanese-related sulfurtransferase
MRPRGRAPWRLIATGLAVAMAVVLVTNLRREDPDAREDREAREAWTRRGAAPAPPALPPDQIDIQLVIRDAVHGPMVVIDTRDAGAFAAGHIPRAFSVSQLAAALAAARAKPKRLPIVVIGQDAQDPGPQALAETLRQQGHAPVLVCPGGMAAWLANHQDLVR